MWTILILVPLLVYLPLLREPLAIPELAAFYVWNEGMDLAGWIRGYLDLNNPGWYRPTAFFTYFQLLTLWVDWHDIFTMRLVAIGHMSALGAAVYLFARQLRLGTRGGAAVAAVAVAIHPVQAMQVVDLIHFDTIYQTCILLVAAWIFRRPTGSRIREALYLVGALLAWFLALTAKEQSVAFAGFVFLMLLSGLLRRRTGVPDLGLPRLDGPRLAAGAVIIISSFALFVVRYLTLRGGYTDGAYRVSADWSQIPLNLIAAFDWMAHLMLSDTPSWPHYNEFVGGPLFYLVGLLWTGGALLYVFQVLRHGSSADRGRVGVVAAWTATFLILPVFSGGRPWHLGLALVGFAILAGNGLAWALQRIPSFRARLWLGTAALVLVVIVEARNKLDERQFRRPSQIVVAAALEQPPVDASEIPEGATIVYENEGDPWIYGDGNFWRYALQRVDIVELPITDIERLTPAQVADLASAPEVYYFTFRRAGSGGRWEDQTSWFERQYLAPEIGFNRIKIRFGNRSHLNRYSAEGLSGLEAWGRWTDNHVTTLIIHHPPAGLGAMELRITGYPFLPFDNSEFKMELAVNGVPLDPRHFARDEAPFAMPLVWTIPETALPRDGPLHIQFRWTGIASPLDAGLGEDPRSLGFAFEHLELRRKLPTPPQEPNID